ncbi:MAG: galactose-1-epimerase [Planctomycetota bacterium]|nr:MAG: galactose-1-epimerase [Planctomycetota bacterium]
MDIKKEKFGSVNGVEVDLYIFKNDNGMEIKISNYGGIITSISTPNKQGEVGEITMGFDNVEDYVKGCPYFGCIVGRIGNRIAKGKFELDGKVYDLAINNFTNHLHGGNVGFDKIVWDAELIQDSDSVGIELKYLSKDGEENYPGNLSVTLTYRLTSENELKIDYFATTDQATVCNLTNHAYFNLKDGGESSVLDHELAINADEFLPVNADSIPLGTILAVKDTPFDFNKSITIGERINNDDEQLKNGIGYDHNYIVNGKSGEMRFAAKVFEASSGRVMEVYTDQPGIQLYSGNYLDGSLTGRNGAIYKHRNALCLETQHYPDSPNQSNFPSVVLRPGEKYETSTIYKFKVI